MKAWILASLPLIALAGCSDPAATTQSSTRSEISIVGSSTVQPFAKAVAEKFYQTDTSRKSPTVESTGSGGGIELFCKGIGAKTPDIVNSSRRMHASELKRCQENGVTDVIELVVGIDGIAIAQSIDGPAMELTTGDLYRALAANPFGQKNESAKWPSINSSLPDENISIYGPPDTSGTREALEVLLMEPGCVADAKMKALKDSDKEAFKTTCHEVRSDGKYVEAGENDNLIVQKLTKSPKSIGIFGYSFLEENADKVRAIKVNGVMPTYETISNGSYPGGRPLYVYVKKKHLEIIPGITEYLTEFLNAGAPDGYLKGIGLVSSSPEVREQMRLRLEQKATITPEDLD